MCKITTMTENKQAHISMRNLQESCLMFRWPCSPSCLEVQVKPPADIQLLDTCVMKAAQCSPGRCLDVQALRSHYRLCSFRALTAAHLSSARPPHPADYFSHAATLHQHSRNHLPACSPPKGACSLQTQRNFRPFRLSLSSNIYVGVMINCI